jgi:TonB-dependent starch-binding outer membrane protein SusC
MKRLLQLPWQVKISISKSLIALLFVSFTFANSAKAIEILDNVEMLSIEIDSSSSPDEENASNVAIIISGNVTDENGQPMPGVNVIVKGTTTGTSTDAQGAFKLSIPDENANGTLIFSFIGYESEEVAINNKTIIDMRLIPDLKTLQEVVVVGFGVQKKINLTGAVTQISSDRLANRPVANMGQALQGVIPNLNVTITDGSPNNSPSFNIRGGTSFSNGSISNGSPLILVDGIEMDINKLNPQDIESISVLKDAASAAIYGSRAAFGVMLVTTKKGKLGERVKISYDNSFQWNTPSAIPNLLNNYDGQDVRIKALQLENKSVPSDMITRLEKIKAYNADPQNVDPYYMKGSTIDWIANTDVYNLAVQKLSPMQKHNFSLSGGSEKNTYYASVGYQTRDGLYKINTDKSNRYNIMLNFTSQITKMFSLGVSTSYNASHFDEPVSPGGKGGWWIAMDRDPSYNINMPMKTPANSPVGVKYTENILSYMDYGSRNNIDDETIILQATPTITISKDWKIKGNFAHKAYNFNRKQVVPQHLRVEFAWDPLIDVHTNPSYVYYGKDHYTQNTINVFTDYTKAFNKHNFYVLAGFNQEWYSSTHLDATGYTLLSPSIPFISQTLGATKDTFDSAEEWALRGGFFRATYNFDEKYLFEINGRYDGSSRFPKTNRFKLFQSYSGAWRITKERFAEAITPVVNELKLRGSYGSLGNQNVSNYIYTPTLSTTAKESHLFDGVLRPGVAAPGLVSPNLTWETATTIDVGLDMTLWEKLDISFDWYNRKTTDILVSGDRFPAVLGTSPPTKNSGEMKTTGWELSTTWKDGLKNGLNYDLAFVLSDYSTEIIKFDGNPNNLLNSLYAGQKAGEIWGYETVGTFQTAADVANAPSQSLINSGVWYPGDIQYRDLSGDNKIGPGAGTLADHGDRRIIGNNTPRYQFGLNSNVSYKGFDLNLFFQGVAKRDFWVSNLFYWGLIRSSRSVGTYDVYNNSWTPERPDAFYPAYKPKRANIQEQTKYLQNAAYLRLKNISLGYTFPKKLIQAAGVNNLRVYASAYNIWELTNAPKIFDPETLSEDYPMIRSYALGLQLTF